jgi:hypothetical protein
MTENLKTTSSHWCQLLKITVTDRKGWPTEESFYDEVIDHKEFTARKDASTTIHIPQSKRIL